MTKNYCMMFKNVLKLQHDGKNWPELVAVEVI
jgi:hypothetical protein